MKRRRFNLGKALDSWSDFAIDCWFWALRFAATLAAALFGATITGNINAERWLQLPGRWQEMTLLIVGTGILLAIAYRIDRALARQRQVRHAPANGGRTPSKRAFRRERARQKRNRQ